MITSRTCFTQRKGNEDIKIPGPIDAELMDIDIFSKSLHGPTTHIFMHMESVRRLLWVGGDMDEYLEVDVKVFIYRRMERES